MKRPHRHILITGAGGGMGRALAAQYAQEGTTFSLWGRNRETLGQSALACQRAGAATSLVVQDIRCAEATRAALLQCDETLPCDIVFLNAGVSTGVMPGRCCEPAQDALRVMEINATATIGMAALLLERMAARGQGHLVFISSLAALYPLPSSPAYCAAKTALACYARAIRGAHPSVRVSVVYPGYVDTPMSRRLKGPQPGRWSAEKAAAHIQNRLERGADTIAFPALLALGTWSLNLLPPFLAGFFAKNFSFTIEPDKESPLYKEGNTDE